METLLDRLIVEMVLGLANGMVLALVAAGFTLILGVMNIVNFAHGEFHMAGAYAGWIFLLLLGPTATTFWIAVFVAGIAVALIGWFLERGVFADTHGGDPFIPMLVSFGLALVFQQVALASFGSIGKFVAPPITASVPFFGFDFPVYRIVIMVISAAIIALLWLFITRTKWGTWIRAIIQDREMAACMGVRVPRVYQIVFALSAGLAGVSGIMAAPIFSVSSTMGLDIIITAFIIVVVGGMGSLTGTLIAALLIGQLEAVSSIFMGASQAQIASLVFLMVFLMIRPQGIFGDRGLA
jgi:branched-subunit amino acid ABC-type transport system permease component